MICQDQPCGSEATHSLTQQNVRINYCEYHLESHIDIKNGPYAINEVQAPRRFGVNHHDGSYNNVD